MAERGGIARGAYVGAAGPREIVRNDRGVAPMRAVMLARLTHLRRAPLARPSVAAVDERLHGDHARESMTSQRSRSRALRSAATAAGVVAAALVGSWVAPGRALAALALVSMLLLPAPASAFRTAADDMGVDGPVRAARRVQVATYGGLPDGLAPDELATVLEAAAESWSAECADFSFEYVGPTASLPSELDGTTTVVFVTEGWDRRGYSVSRAAVTEQRFTMVGTRTALADADIYVNAVDFVWTDGSIDLGAVLLHELGHSAAISHNCEIAPRGGEPVCTAAHAEEAIMYPEYSSVAIAPRADDLAALCFLYPRDPCADTVCAAGEVCQGGVCGAVSICTDGTPCAAGECATAGAASGMCVAPGTEGATCGVGNDCLSRLCLMAPGTAYCTRPCAADDDCAAGQACRNVFGHSVCGPVPPSGGCVAFGGRPARGCLAPRILRQIFV